MHMLSRYAGSISRAFARRAITGLYLKILDTAPTKRPMIPMTFVKPVYRVKVRQEVL